MHLSVYFRFLRLFPLMPKRRGKNTNTIISRSAATIVLMSRNIVARLKREHRPLIRRYRKATTGQYASIKIRSSVRTGFPITTITLGAALTSTAASTMQQCCTSVPHAQLLPWGRGGERLLLLLLAAKDLGAGGSGT